MELPRTLKILQHNVRDWSTLKTSLSNSYNEISPDIILINSHGEPNANKIKIFNYTVHQSNKTQQKNDGVAIAIKRNLQYKIILDFEEEVMAVNVPTTSGEVIIATCYLPPRRPNLPFPDFIKITNYAQPAYLIGDVNARHRIFNNNNINPVGTALAAIINTGRLSHLGPTFPTFLSHNAATAPDKVLSNNKAYFNYVIQEGPLTTSDHIPIVFTISTAPIQIPTQPRLMTSKTNWLKYKEILGNHPAAPLQDATLEEIDEETSRLHTAIKETIRKTTPMTRYKTLLANKQTERVKLLQTRYSNIQQFIRLYGINRQVWAMIHEIQDELKQEYQKLSNDKWNKLIEDLEIDSKDPKVFWRTIHKMMGTERCNTTNYIKDQNGRKLYSDADKEREFRKRWSKVFDISEEENENFDDENERIVNQYLRTRLHRITPYHTADLARLRVTAIIRLREVLHWLRSFKNKAPGLSGITRNMLLNLPSKPHEALLNIYNASLSAGYFPDELKKAKLIFIPKPAKDHAQSINYRPISLLEITGKLLEKILNNRLIKFLELTKQYNPRQHGFRHGRDTQTALAMITEKVAIAKREGHQVNLILRDVEKAFDKVWHPGMKYKLLQLGLPPELERILCDYLDNRTARIQVGNYLGPEFELKAGTPQGSVLSPNLYQLYVRDQPPPAPHSEYIMFADDTTQIVTYKGKSEKIMASHTARAIKKINDYEKKWKIKTSVNKFKIIPMAKKKLEPVVVDGDLYSYAKEGHILGMKITTTGYRSFVKDKLRSMNARLAKVKRFRNISSKNKKKLYTALIKSALLYPTVPLNAMYPSNMKRLQTIQSKSLRFVYNVNPLSRTTNESLHIRAGLEPINIELYNRATTVWDKVNEINEEGQFNLDEEQERGIAPRRDHRYFPSSKKLVNQQLPRPKYN